MGDLLEILVVIIVIVSISSAASRNKGKKRPGQQARPSAKPVRQAQAKPVSQSGQPNMRQVKPRTQAAPVQSTMEAEQMIPEPLVPEQMVPELLRSELAEGESRSDEQGCVGGSLIHDESTHQGVEFHPDDMHGERRYRPETRSPQPVAAPASVSATQLQNAVIWAEILDRPVSMRE